MTGEGQLLERWGRFGRFLACERYPDCKYIKKQEKGTGITCPQCKQEVVESDKYCPYCA